MFMTKQAKKIMNMDKLKSNKWFLKKNQTNPPLKIGIPLLMLVPH